MKLNVIIETGGHATNIELMNGLGHGLDEKAIEAVRNWRFNPAKGSNVTPARVITVIEVTFRLLHR